MSAQPSANSQAPLMGLDLLAALGVVVIWGLNFVAMKFSLRDFTPFQLGTFRYVFAVLPLLFFIKKPKLSWRWLLPAGLAQLGQFGLLFVALQVGMTAALASVLMQTQVFFTTLLGMVLLHERLNGPLRAGLVLAAAGLACFALNLGGASGGITLLSLLLNLGAAAMWAVSNIIVRRAQQSQPGYDPLGFVVWMSLVPILPFAVMAWCFEPAATRWQWTHASFGAWAGVAYLGWFATIAAYAMWTWLLKRHAANRVAPFSLGVPVIGLAAGMLALGETVSGWQWAGSACVVMALAVVMFGGRWRRG
ncbi:EamA family transporter [Variovorax sp. N23]|uniref:EamA family transporter n=1 Tax=Variovorax sp. N23 TaxID=2980555 RepID=UPI0021C90C36|nr:EamA family transporter [Variovorax sp. N23]MCU4120664.1 EamA family transporter [Variovorax sp. N23]